MNESNSKVEYFEKRKKQKYQDGHQGPFLIFIERVDNSNANEVSKISFIKSLKKHDQFDEFIEKAYDFKNSGLNRFKVTVKNAKIANNFVDIFNSLIDSREKELWEAFIPHYKLFKHYVLSGIDDPSITEEEVLQWLGPYRGIGEFPKPIKCEELSKRIERNLPN